MYTSGLFDDLDAQRRSHRAELLDAIQSVPLLQLDLDGWGRIVPYEYCLNPLSSIGSRKFIGGRFNFGEDIDAGLFPSFGALYLAETEATARAETFGAPSNTNGMSVEELALANVRSYAYVRVKGSLESVFDLTDDASLRPFVRATKSFTLAPWVIHAADVAGLPKPYLIRNSKELLKTFMKTDWRIEPAQFNRPSNSQAFGDLVRRAGIEAILYRSAKSEGRCLAIFPETFAFSSSFVELDGAVPDNIVVQRLDRATGAEL